MDKDNGNNSGSGDERLRGSWKVGLDATGDGSPNFVFKTRGGLLAAVTAVVVAFVALDLLLTGGQTIRALVP